MRPAVPAAATFRACHQLWSSLLMICRMSPVLKGIPAWAQGMRSSSRGSYSNWALTKMSQGGGAERYEGTIWNIKTIYEVLELNFGIEEKNLAFLLCAHRKNELIRCELNSLNYHLIESSFLDVILNSKIWKLVLASLAGRYPGNGSKGLLVLTLIASSI